MHLLLMYAYSHAQPEMRRSNSPLQPNTLLTVCTLMIPREQGHQLSLMGQHCSPNRKVLQQTYQTQRYVFSRSG